MGSKTDQIKRRASLVGSGLIFNQKCGAGANLNANIAITGILVGDTLIAALNLADGVDLLAGMTITSDGNVQSSTVDTTADLVLVTWLSANK